MAYFVIDIPPGLDESDLAMATHGDDDELLQEAPTVSMLATAGFRCVEEWDVSDEYLTVVCAWLAKARELEPELRQVLGDTMYEDKMELREHGFAMTSAGLHRRMFYLAEPS